MSVIKDGRVVHKSFKDKPVAYHKRKTRLTAITFMNNYDSQWTALNPRYYGTYSHHHKAGRCHYSRSLDSSEQPQRKQSAPQGPTTCRYSNCSWRLRRDENKTDFSEMNCSLHNLIYYRLLVAEYLRS